MSKKDFFDDDLIQKRDVIKEVNVGPGHEPQEEDDIPKSETVPVRELNLTPLTKRKEEINSQVASKLEELERLRARQDSLEREKNALELLRNNQEKYEGGKREMIDHLEQCLVSFEREEIMLNQRLELLLGTEKRFKAMDKELRTLNEEEWPADSNGHREELTKALAVVETMRKEYHKALSRLEAVRESKFSKMKDQSLLDDESAQESVRRRTFGEWIAVGLAFNLPLILVLCALIALLALTYPLF